MSWGLLRSSGSEFVTKKEKKRWDDDDDEKAKL